MADMNRNQANQPYRSNEDWDQNRERYDRGNEYDQNVGYGNTGYNRNEMNDPNYENPQYGREWDNYRTRTLSSNAGNQNYGNAGNYTGDFGRRSNMGNTSNMGNDYNRNRRENDYGNYESRNRGNEYNQNYGNYNNASDYGRSDYDSNYGQYRNRSNDYNRGNMSSDYNRGMRGDYGYTGGFRNTNYGGSYNAGQERNYENENRSDRDWWDKTKDQVSSWFGDDDADRRLRNDRQNTGLHRGKGPKGYQRSDERIREDVCDRLSDDSYLDASDIEVKVDHNTVVLRGNVDSREAKRRAEDLAESISGVSDVENHLHVGRSMDTDMRSGSSSTQNVSNANTNKSNR